MRKMNVLGKFSQVTRENSPRDHLLIYLLHTITPCGALYEIYNSTDGGPSFKILMDLLISGCWHRGTRWPFTQWPFRHPAESFRDFSEEGVEISPRRVLHNLRGSVKFALLTCWQILLQNQPILVTINARFRNSRRKLVKVEIYSTSKFPNGFNLWFNRTQDNAPHTLNQHIPQL